MLVELFLHLDEVDNPLLEVIKLADLHCMEEVRLREVTHVTGNKSKHVESSVNMARGEFGISCLGVGITERPIKVMISPRVMLVRSDIISKFVLWTLAPKTDMLLEMM